MKRINRLIRGLVLEIFITIIFVIGSVPIWQNFKIRNLTVAENSFNTVEKKDYEIADFDDYVLYQTSDQDAIKNIKPIKISYNMIDSDLFLLISKSSTIDYSALKLYYDNEIIKVNELPMHEDNTYYYFKINTKENLDIHLLKIWVDAKTTSNTYNKKLIFDIEAIKKQDL